MTRLAGVKADKPSSHKKLEAVASKVREMLHVGPTKAIDPLKLFEDLDKIIIKHGGMRIPLNYRVSNLEDSEGYTRYDKEQKCIEVIASVYTYDRLESRHPRAGFFVGHELGHCLLHTGQLVRLAQMPTNQLAAMHRGATVHQVYEDTEWQANGFAGALFMPAKGLAQLQQTYGLLTIDMIQETFKVSYEAAGIRRDVFSQRREILLV